MRAGLTIHQRGRIFLSYGVSTPRGPLRRTIWPWRPNQLIESARSAGHGCTHPQATIEAKEIFRSAHLADPRESSVLRPPPLYALPHCRYAADSAAIAPFDSGSISGDRPGKAVTPQPGRLNLPGNALSLTPGPRAPSNLGPLRRRARVQTLEQRRRTHPTPNKWGTPKFPRRSRRIAGNDPGRCTSSRSVSLSRQRISHR